MKLIIDEGLTPKEVEIITLLASNKSRNEVFNHLNITYHTFRTHIKNIYRKLELVNTNLKSDNRFFIVKKALQLGIITVEDIKKEQE